MATEPQLSLEQAIDEALKFWQPRYTKKLTREDARQIIENLGGFYGLLLQWDREDREAERKVAAKDAAESN